MSVKYTFVCLVWQRSVQVSVYICRGHVPGTRRRLGAGVGEEREGAVQPVS